MSTITLMAPTTAEMQRLLTDYEIHLTGAESPSASSITPANASEVQPTRIDSPQTWISNHRRIPDYRPVNRELDWNERTLGSNPFEFVFLNLMFTGVSLNAVSITDCRERIVH